MFSFLFQLPRLLASMAASAAENIQHTVTRVVTTVTAVGLFTASTQITAPQNGGAANQNVNTTKAPKTEVTVKASAPAQTPEPQRNSASFSNEQARIVAQAQHGDSLTQSVENVSKTDGEVQDLSVDNVTFDAGNSVEKKEYSAKQKKLAELVYYARQSEIGRSLVEQAAKHNVDLVFDYTTEFNAYYNAEEGQVALNGKYEKAAEKAELAEAVFNLFEELAHVNHNTKDSLFVHDYLNKAEKPVEVQYFSPEGYFHVRRNEEATAKTVACMAFDEWGQSAQGKTFVDAYTQANAGTGDYMAQAFDTYRKELSGRLDVPSRILAASNTYLDLMTNPVFTDTYDNLVSQMDNHDIWTHARHATFVEPTHDILQQAGKIVIGNHDYNILSNYVDLTEPVFRQYSATAVACIQEKSQELQVASPEFTASDISADGQVRHFMPASSTLDFMMRDTGLLATSSLDNTVSVQDEIKNATVKTEFSVLPPTGHPSQNLTSASPAPVLEHD